MEASLETRNDKEEIPGKGSPQLCLQELGGKGGPEGCGMYVWKEFEERRE